MRLVALVARGGSLVAPRRYQINPRISGTCAGWERGSAFAGARAHAYAREALPRYQHGLSRGNRRVYVGSARRFSGATKRYQRYHEGGGR